MEFSIGNKTISSKKHLRGFSVGNILIKSGAALVVDGFLIGNIFVEVGASLKLDGFLIGNIINFGGDTNIDGLVIGNKNNRRQITNGI